MSNQINDYIEKNKDRFLDELFKLLRIPSVSADPKYKDDVIRTAEAIKEKLKRAQSTVSTMAMPVSPPASSDEYESEDDHQVPRRSSKDRQYRGE